MTAELVTGFAGQNHITSDQVGAAMAGIVGTGAYVMAVGGRCAVSMTAANTCHMADGYVVIGGRVVKISATDLSIATGGQSVKRHDLVCVEYDKNPSTGVETASLVVVKGTAGTTAADPSYIAGDILAGASTAQFPLARVSLDGLTPTVELVADVLSPTKTLQDSASWTLIGSATASNSIALDLTGKSELLLMVGIGASDGARICPMIVPVPYLTSADQTLWIGYGIGSATYAVLAVRLDSVKIGSCQFNGSTTTSYATLKVYAR